MYYNKTFAQFLHVLLLGGFLAALAYKVLAPELFTLSFAREDGIIEYSTAILLFVGALGLFGLARRVTGYKRWLLALYVLAFIFAAGEEVSWGQRIFDIQSTEFFLENNRQGETNLHNLVVGDVHLASAIFGNVLTPILLLYLVVLPLLYGPFGWVRRFCEALAIPVPPIYIAGWALLWTVFVLWIDLNRNWEVYEFAFSVFVCLIFFAPRNRATFNFDPV